jgi:hypothetical protein
MFTWIKKIFRRITTYLMIALYNTEKSSLGQQGSYMGEDMGHFQSINQGTMLDDLLRGRVTQEVKTLRWRMYKVLAAASSVKAVPMKDENGNIIMDDEGYITYTTEAINKSHELRKIKIDEYDNYPLEMVVINTPKPRSSHEDINPDKILETDKRSNKLSGELESDSNSGVTTSRVVGEISSDEFYTLIQSEPKIEIVREYPPKIKIEKYTKKLNVRKMDGDERLLEFYVSKYPNEYDRKSDVFIKNVLKIDANPRISSIIDFQGVKFSTYNDTGVHDNKLYEYEIVSYDKTIEFDGHYVIKMKAKVTTDGEDLTEKYRMEDLDERYENKERRDESSSSSYIIQFE